MQTIIQARGFKMTEALENHVQKRLGFSLSRVMSRIRRISVRLSDLNGPRGGIDKRCQIEVDIDGLPVVVVDDTQSDMYTAINRALGRAGRTVMRRLALNSNRRHQQTAHVMHHLSTGM